MKKIKSLKLKQVLGLQNSAEDTQQDTTDISSSTERKSNLKITKILRRTSSGRHVWVEAITKEGKEIIVRKPIDSFEECPTCNTLEDEQRNS